MTWLGYSDPEGDTCLCCDTEVTGRLVELCARCGARGLCSDCLEQHLEQSLCAPDGCGHCGRSCDVRELELCGGCGLQACCQEGTAACPKLIRNGCTVSDHVAVMNLPAETFREAVEGAELWWAEEDEGTLVGTCRTCRQMIVQSRPGPGLNEEEQQG